MGVFRLYLKLEKCEEKLWYLLVVGLFSFSWVHGLGIGYGRVMGIPLGTFGCMTWDLLILL